MRLLRQSGETACFMTGQPGMEALARDPIGLRDLADRVAVPGRPRGRRHNAVPSWSAPQALGHRLAPMSKGRWGRGVKHHPELICPGSAKPTHRIQWAARVSIPAPWD
jgi:hypothetical protein